MSFLEDTKYTFIEATPDCSCYFQNGFFVSTITNFETPFLEYTKYTSEKNTLDLKKFFWNGLFVSKNGFKIAIP